MNDEKKVPPLPPGSTADVVVQSVTDDGVGHCLLDGRTVTIPRGVPGDRCRIRIVESHRRHALATIESLLVPSAERVTTPRCHNNRCDGCSLISWSDEAQHRWKEQRVRRELSRHGLFTGIDRISFCSSPAPLFYRNSAKLVIGGTSARPLIGIYRRWSHQVIDLVTCPLHHPLIDTITAVVREGIRTLNIPVYHETRKSGLLRYLVVRVDETGNQAAVAFVTAFRSYNEIHHLFRFLSERVPQVTVASQNVNPSEGNAIFGESDHPLTRKRHLVVPVGHLTLELTPRSFFQVHTDQTLTLYRHATRMLKLSGGERVLDLFCGIGGIGLFAARVGIELTGVEFLPEAVASAQANARRNGLRDARFIAGDATSVAGELIDEGERFDRVILNPPRGGCAERLLARLPETGAERIVYVSCNPVTLARDLAVLVRKGYREEEVVAVDMFPQTHHVETVVSLVREGGRSGRVSPPRATPSSRRSRGKRGGRGG